MVLTVEQLAKRLGAELVVHPPSSVVHRIKAVGPVETAGGDEVTFLSPTASLRKQGVGAISRSRAGAVIVGERIKGLAMPQLIVRNVDAALIEALGIFAPQLRPPVEGIDRSAKVGQDVKIAQGVSIGAGVVLSDKVEIGQDSVIGSGCKIGENSSIGANCRLDGNVVIYHNCRIGNNVIIQANSTIGSTGFGYCRIEGEHKLIPHNGGVVIEDFVEIGANCCVDRAKFGNTVIGAGTKIDNLVQIAHNVIIGKCCLIVAQVGIAGSCKIGDGVVLGGQVGVADNIEIGDGVMVGGQSGVTRDVPAKSRLFGTPATGIAEASKILSLTKRLPKLAETVRQLRKRIEKLEQETSNQ